MSVSHQEDSRPGPELLSFQLGGLVFRVECDSEEDRLRVGDFLNQLFAITPVATLAVASDVAIQLRSSAAAARSAPLVREVSRSAHLNVWETANGFRLNCGTSCVDLDLANSRGIGVLHPEFWTLPLGERREMFMLSFLMLLNRHKIFGLHGNAVARGRTGFLIVAGSGCGKTTLALTLIRSGWEYVADDALLLRRDREGGVDVLALRRGFSCTEKTAAAFGELAGAVRESLGSAKDKWLVDSDAVYADQLTPQCHPEVILFPRICDTETTRFRPIKASAALGGLVEQSPGILSDQSDSTEQGGLLLSLLHQCKAFQVELGTDLFDRPQAVCDAVSALRSE